MGSDSNSNDSYGGILLDLFERSCLGEEAAWEEFRSIMIPKAMELLCKKRFFHGGGKGRDEEWFKQKASGVLDAVCERLRALRESESPDLEVILLEEVERFYKGYLLQRACRGDEKARQEFRRIMAPEAEALLKKNRQLRKSYDEEWFFDSARLLMDSIEERFDELRTERNPDPEKILKREARKFIRSVLSAGHSPSMGSLTDMILMWLEMMELVFSSCPKPHQLIVFLYRIEMEIPPREIVKKHSNQTLGELFRDFIEAYSYLIDSTGERYFSPLILKLEGKVMDVYVEPDYSKLVSSSGGKKVKDMRLCDFYGKDPARSIAEWVYYTKGRAREAYSSGSLCS